MCAHKSVCSIIPAFAIVCPVNYEKKLPPLTGMQLVFHQTIEMENGKKRVFLDIEINNFFLHQLRLQDAFNFPRPSSHPHHQRAG
jgi:hypothetical protein